MSLWYYFNMVTNLFALSRLRLIYSPIIWTIFDLSGLFVIEIKVIHAGNLCHTTSILNRMIDRTSHWN